MINKCVEVLVASTLLSFDEAGSVCDGPTQRHTSRMGDGWKPRMDVAASMSMSTADREGEGQGRRRPPAGDRRPPQREIPQNQRVCFQSMIAINRTTGQYQSSKISPPTRSPSLTRR